MFHNQPTLSVRYVVVIYSVSHHQLLKKCYRQLFIERNQLSTVYIHMHNKYYTMYPTYVREVEGRGVDRIKSWGGGSDIIL